MDGTLIPVAGLRLPEARQEIRLPALREELRLLPAASNHDGSPAWMVQDPVNNRFFRIGWIDFEVLLRWGEGSASVIVESVTEETTLNIDESDVLALVTFLDQHSLLRADSTQAVDRLRQRAKLQQKSVYTWLLHNYLFFRIPLIRPQAMLALILPWLSWLFTRTTATVVVLGSLLGLFLAARQWQVFVSVAVDHMTWAGVLGYTVALVFAKALHEVGHALTATRYGVRVAHMGVALLVMFPMLYTDTSESWKLARSRERLAIASAGIVTELAIAGLATLAWSLTPDGGVRNALFFLATTSWVLTLLVNASPFMRFDGYFIVTDVLDFPNLHERSGALARTWLRRTLLGVTDAWPERLAGYGNAGLIAFALVTWVYRLVVFLGIALVVYYFFFKILGIFLMLVEVVWFIAKPVWSELAVWWSRRSEIKTNRIVLSCFLGAMLLLAAMVPWQTSVKGVGWLHPERQHVVFSPLAGKLTALPVAGAVTPGQILFTLESPDLQLAQQRATGLADARSQELLGLTGLQDGEERRAQVTSQQDKFLAEASLYSGERSRMQLAAPFAGVLSDLDPQLTAGVWVAPRQPLAVVMDPTSWTVEAFVAEEDVARVRVGDAARIHLGARSLAVLQGRVKEVDSSRTSVLPHSMLDARAGGPLATIAATNDNQRQERAPKDAIYRVRIEVLGIPQGQQMMLANVVVAGEERAWLPSILTRIAAVAVRESGF
jgi:putative peptide zinc metalloprotease protein